MIRSKVYEMKKKGYLKIFELASELEMKKSKAMYYRDFGIFQSRKKIGSVKYYNLEECSQVYNNINTLREKGYSLSEIIDILKNLKKEKKENEKKQKGV